MERQSTENKTDLHNRKFPFRVSSRPYLWIIAAFTVIGVAGGLIYYLKVGCNTGGCMITSSPYMSMIWGGLVGYLIPDLFVKQETGS